jgi:hypothetical protein
MARPPSSQRDERHQLSRRAFIKWSLAAGAALGVSRSRIFEILDRTAGKGVAFAAEMSTTRLVSLACGNGGLAHFQLFWPQNDIAAARDPAFAWHRIGDEQLVDGTDNPLTIGPDTPWASLPAHRQVTGFVCGSTETHVRNVQSTSILNGSNVFAIASVLQASSPALLPVVTLGDTSIGSAISDPSSGGAGPPIPVSVGGADDLVRLFDGAATHAGGVLARMGDAQLFKAQYDTFVQLNRAQSRYTQKPVYDTGRSAAQLVGINLAPRLAITPADLARYGIDGNTRANVAALGRAFIVIVKAFQMDLANTVLLPAMTDDPHNHFTNNGVNVVPGQLKAVFDAFMNDLEATLDDATRAPLADSTVIVMNGDTPKNCLDRNRWPDSTPQNANLMFLYSAGYLKSGWFGGIGRTGKVWGAGPDGKPAAYNSAMTAKYATASLAYAVARGDEHAIAPFTNGITIGGVFGVPKNK